MASTVLCTLSMGCKEFSLPTCVTFRSHKLNDSKNYKNFIEAEEIVYTFTTLMHQYRFLLSFSDQYTFQ